MKPLRQQLKKKEHSIVHIRLETDGAWISICCQQCSHVFETYGTTVGGVTVGEYICPECRQAFKVMPDMFQEAITGLIPEFRRDATTKIMQEAVRITESWYLTEPIKGTLNYYGVNLGQGAEKELLPHVVHGLLKAYEKGMNET